MKFGKWVIGKHVSIVLSLVLLLSVVAAGCSSGNEKGNDKVGATTPTTTTEVTKTTEVADAKAENVELRFTWWGGQDRADRTIKMIEKFQELHPNITIKPEYTAWPNYFEKMSTQIAGNDAPDLITMSVLYIQDYLDRGVLLDLEPYIGNEIKVDDLSQSLLENQKQTYGKLTSLPLADNASAMIYNKELYTQAGVEAPKMDMTWEEFFAKARELKGKLGDKVYGANDMSGLYEAFMYYVLNSGDVMYKDKQLGYNDEKLKAWLKMWDDARKEGLVPPASDTASYIVQTLDPNTEPLMKGTVAIEGNLSMATFFAFNSTMPNKVGLTTIPRLSDSKKTNGSVLLTASYLAINSKSKHPKEAAMFIDYMINSTEAGDILGNDRGMPDNKIIRERIAKNFTEVDKGMLSMLEHVEASDPNWYDGGPKGSGSLGKVFEQTVQKQQYGKATIDEVVDEFRKEGNKILAKNN